MTCIINNNLYTNLNLRHLTTINFLILSPFPSSKCMTFCKYITLSGIENQEEFHRIFLTDIITLQTFLEIMNILNKQGDMFVFDNVNKIIHYLRIRSYWLKIKMK